LDATFKGGISLWRGDVVDWLSDNAGGNDLVHSSRKETGFTLVELLVVVVIIGILAAIALPNFIGAQKKAKTASVKGNMRTIQIASESYATDSGGSYSPNAGTWVNYLPGGSNQLTGKPGNFPVNPVTGKAPAALNDAGLATSTAIQNQKTTAAAGAGGKAAAGDPAYCVADAGNSYAVSGSDPDGNYVSGTGGRCLILSNQ
jgi:prepilin-type N-terminal cleavage/methylation domain-containing protein